MQLLFVHADHLEFEAVTEAGEDLAETEGVPMEGRMEDCVTVFVTVERGDEADPDAVVQNGAAEVRDVADQLNTRKVVLYPSAHLSDDLAAPDSATTVLRNLQTELDADFEVLRAPFGWYKAVEVASKGHPLSELSRHVGPERPDEAEEDGERAPSEWRLAFPDGEIASLPEGDPLDALDALDADHAEHAEYADRVSDDLRALVEAEVEGETTSASEGGQPSHVELAREQELAGYDDLGDAGTLRWYPRGKLVRDSIAEYVTDLAVEYGAMPVEGSGDRRTPRPAACFDFVDDAPISERDLPLRIYESSTTCSRCERRDDDADRTRQQRFTTPAMHTATRDVKQAKEELRAQVGLAQQTGEDFGLNYVPVVRLTREFYDDNEAWVQSLVSDLDTPALLEIHPERHPCWSVEVAFATIDRSGRPIENATIQLDVEGGEQFDIEYTAGETARDEETQDNEENGDDEGRDGKTRHPSILHCSPSGSIERALAALLERAAQLETPRLPTWLSPTQVRFVPVGEEHVEYCDALVEDLESVGIRADVDERDESVGKRIASAETDWVPYYAVVGDRELESDDDALGVNVRGADEEREMTVEELQATVLDDVGDLPKKKRYLPKRVSKHPNFTGR